MTIVITLPNGKELTFSKGSKGVDKLFVTNLGEVVVVTGKTITKFGGCAYVCEFEKKADKDEDIEA